ncbi:MAG: RlmE family RNA methyltransferase [Spirochaetaceae bacterium]|jgi:23S rRNA (uridine2552-2'-O)-methyltransferase|nr:RlmE family RNA methyltransferase [Spirochaetaceae bacterium]
MSDYKKPDYWSLKAQKEGYPARSVYKLREMDEKFSLLPRFGGADTPFKILDLGAAPGSWSLYVLRRMAGRGFLAAADLTPLSRQYDGGLFEGKNFYFIRGDITEQEIQETLAARGPYHLVMSDAAPATTGNRSVDTLRSLALVETVIHYAETALAPGGSLVAKVFQGEGAPEILKGIRERFRTGKSFKPQACRGSSFETYYIGLGKK